MTTFEQVNQVQSEARKEMLQTIIKNQEVADKRTRALEIKVWTGIGIVVAAKIAFEIIPLLVHKP